MSNGSIYHKTPRTLPIYKKHKGAENIVRGHQIPWSLKSPLRTRKKPTIDVYVVCDIRSRHRLNDIPAKHLRRPSHYLLKQTARLVFSAVRN